MLGDYTNYRPITMDNSQVTEFLKLLDEYVVAMSNKHVPSFNKQQAKDKLAKFLRGPSNDLNV